MSVLAQTDANRRLRWRRPQQQSGAVSGAPKNSDAGSQAAAHDQIIVSRADGSSLKQVIALDGQAWYLSHFLCPDEDRSMYDRLLQELKSKFKKHHGNSLNVFGSVELFDECPTYRDVVVRLAKHFNVEVIRSVVNWYQDGRNGVGPHSDSYGAGENITIGASFGEQRAIVFEHKRSHKKLEFPQRNGDVFAFTDVVNKAWRHSVPKSRKHVGGRLSIILWARQGGFLPVQIRPITVGPYVDRETGVHEDNPIDEPSASNELY